MLHFSVHLSSDLSRALPPGLANPAAASLAAAGGVQRAVQENFLRRGGKSFWPQAAELTKVSPAGADGALVSVYRRGVALRLLGGRVQAKPGHSMALPVKRGDSDLWPREIPGLSLVRWRSGGKVRAMANTTRPAQELYRAWPARQERDWPTRWEDAANAVGWEGVAQNGQMIALTTSPIWVELSRFGLPYPPFDYGSHMSVRLVSLEKCIEIGLVDDPQALHVQMESARSSFNEGVEVDASGWSKDILAEIEKQLQGLAVLDHGVLRMTDPNGTSPYPPEKLAEVITAPLPGGIPHLQLKALRDWMEESGRFDGELPQVGLNEKEDMARLIRRCMSAPSAQTLERGMSFSTQEKMQHFITDIRENGYYRALPGKVADSWSMSDRAAERYADGSDWQIKLICTRHKNAKDLRPLYRSVQPQSKTPTMPLSTEAEMLIPGNVRMKITKITEEKTQRGKRITVYCEEK